MNIHTNREERKIQTKGGPAGDGRTGRTDGRRDGRTDGRTDDALGGHVQAGHLSQGHLHHPLVPTHDDLLRTQPERQRLVLVPRRAAATAAAAAAAPSSSPVRRVERSADRGPVGAANPPGVVDLRCDSVSRCRRALSVARGLVAVSVRGCARESARCERACVRALLSSA